MKPSLRKVLIPTVGQTFGCLAASLAIIGVLYRDQILNRIESGVAAPVLNQLGYGQDLAKVTSSPIIHTGVIVAFWSAVGLVAYTIVWTFINIMIEARNEVVLETEYTNKSALVQRLRTPLTQLALAAGLFVGLLAAAKWAFPFWLGLFEKSLGRPAILQMSLYAVAAVLGTAATIYVLILLGQLVFWVG